MMIEPDNDKVFSNLENIDVAIVEDSFLTQRFKLPDGIYDIIPLKARKKLILKYKRGTKSASFLALKKLLKDEVNYPNHNNSLEKVSEFFKRSESEYVNFNLFKYTRRFLFIIAQNYYAFKVRIKIIIGKKEVGSIFSLGFIRYIKIKNLLK